MHVGIRHVQAASITSLCASVPLHKLFRQSAARSDASLARRAGDCFHVIPPRAEVSVAIAQHLPKKVLSF